jgi:Homeodomain-like domain-containing protein
VAEAPLVTSQKSDKPKQHRLTNLDKAFALRYYAEGLTQAVIAQRLGVTQPAISQWLSLCQDTTAEAGLFLRGTALPMAEKIVKKGRPSDLVKVLQGISVLEPDQKSGLVVNVGGDAIVNFGGAFAPHASAVTPVINSLTGDLGSDNVGYVVTTEPAR